MSRIKINVIMNKLTISILLITKLFLISCTKEFDSDFNEGKYAFQQESFSSEEFLSDSHARNINNSICKAPGDTINAVEMQQIKGQLQELNNNNPGTLELYEKIFGYPVWDANISGAESNGTDWFLIPTVVQEHNSTHAIIVAKRLETNDYELNFYKRYDIIQHLRKNNTATITLVNDIYDLFGICDCNVYCQTIDDSVSVTSRPTMTSRSEIATLTWLVPKDPEEFCEPGFHTVQKSFFAGCSGGGGVGSGGGGSGGGFPGGTFWGGGTGTGGGNSSGGVGQGGGGGLAGNAIIASCIPYLVNVNFFELLQELDGFISRQNIQFEASEIITYINPECLNDLENFDQCVLDHLECLAHALGNSLGLSASEKELLVQNPTTVLLSVLNFLSNESYSQEAESYILVVLGLMDEDPLLIIDRFFELFYLLQSDNEFLTRDCLDNNDPLWDDLMFYVPPSNVLDRLEDLGEGWRLQPLETPTASPSINFDYFSIVIDQMPINPNTNMQYSPDELISYIRRNINAFVNTTLGEFTPFTVNDLNLWQSSSPVPAVLTIDILPDDGSVICAQHESCCWIFSTVKAPQFPLTSDGYHPVSGNRQFGYRILNNGKTEIYTKGVDRFLVKPGLDPLPSVILPYLLEKMAFVGADALWSSFTSKINTYVSEHNGSASINTPIKLRPKWFSNSLIEALRSNNKIEYVPCQD